MDLIGFALSALIIALAGTRLSGIADRLADRTGIGEALMGGVFLGASTSISGSVLSMVSAYDGFTDLAVSNAIGGIAVQTFFLVLADIFYKKANLEHAAVSSTNIMLAALLVRNESCATRAPTVVTLAAIIPFQEGKAGRYP